MKQAGLLFCATVLAFATAHLALGYEAAIALGYGAVAIMSALISLTFLWLWHERATPLALGMSFSWAGTASVMGWWWIFSLAGRPLSMIENRILFLFVSLHMVGAVLHFAVMQRSMRLGYWAFAAPVAAALFLSTVALLAG